MSGKPKIELEFIKQSFKDNRYELLTTDYKNCYQLLEYRCDKGHRHRINWSNWKKGVRCPYCDGQGKPDINVIREYFSNYGYKLLSTKYVNDSAKLEYECPVGHKHSMRWGNFRHGKRCPSCGRIKNSLSKTGNNHYNWQGGKTLEPYSQIWYNYKFKDLIKYRDNYQCQNPNCWHKNNRLSVHHIDYNKQNCKASNLITLCNSCNIRANTNKNYWIPIYNSIVQSKNIILNDTIDMYNSKYQ
jgi:hypothetical protein